MNWHGLTHEEILERTDSRREGLSASEAKAKLSEHGYNQLQEAKKRSPLHILLAQFKDLMILILLAAAIISGIVGDLKDTIVILIIVVLNAVVGFIQEYRAEKAMRAL